MATVPGRRRQPCITLVVHQDFVAHMQRVPLELSHDAGARGAPRDRRAQPPLWQCGRMGGRVAREALAAPATLTAGRRLVAGRYWLGHDAPRCISGEASGLCARRRPIVVLPKQGVPTRCAAGSPTSAADRTVSATVRRRHRAWSSSSSRRSTREASCVSLRIAVLAPVAWRVPPRHYGPWEQFASLLTEGLVPRGVDVTLFASGDSLTGARLASAVAARLGRGSRRRAEGGRVPPHLGGVRTRRRVRSHPQQLRLPSADVQHAVSDARAHDDPRLLVATIVAVYEKYNRLGGYVAISDADRHPRLDYLATIHHGIDTDAFAFHDSPGTYLLFFGRIHPDKGTADAIEVARRAGLPLVIAGIIQDQRYYDDEVAPLRRRRRRSLHRCRSGPDRRPAVLGGARGAAAPHRLRGAVRIQRCRGDGVRHTGDRLPARLHARAHRRRCHRVPRRRRRAGRRRGGRGGSLDRAGYDSRPSPTSAATG